MRETTPLIAMRRPQGERFAGRFWMASWLSPPDPVDGSREMHTRVFDVRRDALEFAHRKRTKTKANVTITAFAVNNLDLPQTAARTGARVYRPGQAPEEDGDV